MCLKILIDYCIFLNFKLSHFRQRQNIQKLFCVCVTVTKKNQACSPQELPEMWNETKKLTLKVSQEVAPMQSAEVIILRRQCMDFEVKKHLCDSDLIIIFKKIASQISVFLLDRTK